MSKLTTKSIGNKKPKLIIHTCGDIRGETCSCKENNNIPYNSTELFDDVSKKADNDKVNKKRESVINALLNDKINPVYYKCSSRWKTLKNELKLYVDEICNRNNINTLWI